MEYKQQKSLNEAIQQVVLSETIKPLDEALVLASDDLNAVKKSAEKLAKQSPDLTYYVVKHKKRFFKGREIPYFEVYASVDWNIARSHGATKVAGYGAKVDMRESVELDEVGRQDYIDSPEGKLSSKQSEVGGVNQFGNRIIHHNKPKWLKKRWQRAAAKRKKKTQESVELDEKVMGAVHPGGHPIRKFSVPASPETKKHIESGKAKVILSVVSVLGPTTRFVVIENPTYRNAKISGQDKVLMFTISDPKKGRIKMFAFHGSHVSHQKAMQFAKNNKLVAKTDDKGNPLYAKESVELGERK